MPEKNVANELVPNKPDWYTLLRIITGLILLGRGINFIFITANLQALLEQAGMSMISKNSNALTFIIAYLDILCGLFITIGLVTRLWAGIQIPLLFVAVFFINLKQLGANSFEFVLSIVTLLLIIVVARKGSGVFSADEYFRRGAALDERGKKQE